MRRRDFIWMFGSGVVTCVVGCNAEPHAPAADAHTGGGGSGDGDGVQPPTDGSVDACVQDTVTMHDTYAQALYYDGTYGPLTGTVTVAHVVASSTITMDFWHGHGGQLHEFILEPSHFDALKRGERITIGTTMVDGHAHTLFIDPRDEDYRVPNAPDVEVSLGCK